MLGNKALTLFGILGIVTIVIGAGLTIGYMRAMALADAEREVANLTRVLSEQTARAVQGVDLILLGTQARLQEGEKSGSLMEPKAIHTLLQARVDGVPQVRLLSVLTANGEVAHVSSRFPAPQASAGDRDYFRVHIDSPGDALYIGVPTFDPFDRTRNFQMSRRLASANGDFRGVISASVDLAYFQELYRSLKLRPGSAIALFRRDGVPLLSEPDDQETIGKAFADVALFRSQSSEPRPAPAHVGAVADGMPQVGAYSEIRGFPLVISVTMDQNAALATWKQQAVLISVGATLMVVLFAAGIVVLGSALRRDATLTHALEQSHRQVQALAAALQSSQEEEQRRIGLELHEGLGQQLTGLLMELAAITPPAGSDQSGLRVKLEHVQASVHETVSALRRICSELRPRMLDNLGLVPALEWLVEGFAERTGIACDLKVVGAVELDDARNSAVFRIVQESLTNVARHAKANRVEVRIERRDSMVAIEVCDDGVGFSVPEAHSLRAYGLLGMRERAHALGGTFALESAPGKGTRVESQIPIASVRETALSPD